MDTSLPLGGSSKRLARMRQGVIHAARLMETELQDAETRYRAAFVTATYRPEATWDAGDIRLLVKHYRQWGQRRGARLGIVWVAEVHSGGGSNRGRIHYHLVIFVPRGLTPPLPDRQGWWRKGMTNCKWARRPVGYLAKYASKGCRGLSLPRGARLWGTSGASPAARVKLRLALAPSWFQQFCNVDDVVRPLANGWWRNCSTGWEYRNPWELEWTTSGPRAKWRGWTEWDVELRPERIEIARSVA